MKGELSIKKVLAAKAGDVAARNELIENYLGYIVCVLIKLVGWSRVNEFLTDGVLGFINAIDDFDLSRASSFPLNYFYTHIKAVVFETIRQESQEAKFVLRSGLMNGVREEAESKLVGVEDTELLDEALAVLNERERSILLEIMEGRSGVEIASDEGVTHQRISQIKYGALKKLQNYFFSRS